MNRRYNTSVGLEIECNYLPNGIDVDWNMWNRSNEHCGVELRTKPVSGIGGLRDLKNSLIRMNRSGGNNLCGFDNAGIHIHIDFLKANPPDKKLIRKAAPFDRANLAYDNPTGSDKKWYWVDRNGISYRSPKEYNASFGVGRKPSSVFDFTGANKHTLLAVKRFMTIGIRFADVLFAIQHPDRRFNKYCHTIEDWDEELLLRQASIRDIAMHPNLQQNHRRHMFNVLSFKKWGTIEIRMLKSSMNADEIWAQLVLFTRLARVARSDTVLPRPTGLITKDFTLLLNLARIRGKSRKILIKMFGRSLKSKQFSCYCYNCYSYFLQTEFYDYGLSRAICRECHKNVACVCCGMGMKRNYLNNSNYVDDMIEGGRWACNDCKKSHNIKLILVSEKNEKYITSLNARVGSGFDNSGFRQLRRMRALFA